MAAPWIDADYMHYLDTTPKAFGTKVAFGYRHDPTPIVEAGLGGFGSVEGGIFRASARATVRHPLKAFLLSCHRLTAATAPTDFTLYYGGATGAYDFTMLGAQNDSWNLTWAVEDPLKIAYAFNGLCAKEAATGDTQEGVVAGITDAWSECDVLIAADYIAQRLSITCTNGARVGSSMDRRSAGYYRLPPYIRSGRPTWAITVRTRDRIPAATLGLDTDAYVSNLGITAISTNLSLVLSNLHCTGETHDATRGDFGEWEYGFNTHLWTPLAIT